MRGQTHHGLNSDPFYMAYQGVKALDERAGIMTQDTKKIHRHGCNTPELA